MGRGSWDVDFARTDSASFFSPLPRPFCPPPTDRCSITLAILVTVNTRTCVCCGRKALLAMDGGKGAAPGADDALGVVDMVLKAATCCVYCGGRWMRIR